MMRVIVPWFCGLVLGADEGLSIPAKTYSVSMAQNIINNA